MKTMMLNDLLKRIPLTTVELSVGETIDRVGKIIIKLQGEYNRLISFMSASKFLLQFKETGIGNCKGALWIQFM